MTFKSTHELLVTPLNYYLKNKNEMKKMFRILIGPAEVAGYYANLARGFREIGVDCDYITSIQHPFNYSGETQTPILLRIAKFFDSFRGRPGRPFIIRAFNALPGEVFRSIWGVFAIYKYDIFIFGFGRSLLPLNVDLRILRLLGKKVISNMAHGADARPPYIDGAYQSKDASLQPTEQQLFSYSKSKFKKMAVIEGYSDVVLGAAFSTTHFSCGSLINTLAVGIPYVWVVPSDPSTNCIPVVSNSALPPSIRILHSPSHPAAKGSPLIVQAISNLKQKGHKIELILLQDKPNSEVIRELRRCDFVVDQLYSDAPMAGFATEAAWFGKPAVVGGYRFDYLKTFVPECMWPPSMTCHPDEIERAIEDLITNPEKRFQLGAAAQRFVRDKWSAAAVARRYLRLIDGDIPEEWLLDPQSVTYLEGAGQPVERTQENIRRMVTKFGVQSLQLSHRPDLEQAFLEFAGLEGSLDAACLSER